MDILIRKEGAILTLAFNRPQRKNAITAAMYQALADALAEADQDDAVKVVLIHGTQDAFTAGNDLEDFLQDPPQREDSPVFQFLHQLSRARKPLVAAVNGVAVGIGTTLLLPAIWYSSATKPSSPCPSPPWAWCPRLLPVSYCRASLATSGRRKLYCWASLSVLNRQ